MSTNQLTELTTSDIQSNFNKTSSFKINSKIKGLIQLNDGSIACFTSNGVKLLKVNNDTLELVKEILDFKEHDNIFAFQNEDDDIIFEGGYAHKNLFICDKDFNVIQKDESSFSFHSLCKLPDLTFSATLDNCSIRIYKKDGTSKKYDYIQSFNFDGNFIFSQIYLPKHNYLILGNNDKSIMVFSLTEEKFIKTISDAHSCGVDTLIYINDDTFASGSKDSKINVWFNFEQYDFLNAHDDYGYAMSLTNLGKNYYVSSQQFYFKIWSTENYSLKTFEEDNRIEKLLATRENNIITVTEDNIAHLWKISSN